MRIALRLRIDGARLGLQQRGTNMLSVDKKARVAIYGKYFDTKTRTALLILQDAPDKLDAAMRKGAIQRRTVSLIKRELIAVRPNSVGPHPFNLVYRALKEAMNKHANKDRSKSATVSGTFARIENRTKGTFETAMRDSVIDRRTKTEVAITLNLVRTGVLGLPPMESVRESLRETLEDVG